MDCFVYIIQSKVNDSFYKGSSDNLVQRLNRHNNKLDTYTKKFAPWNLVWYTCKQSKSEARILERKLKNLSTARLIEFIKKYPVTMQIDGLDVSEVKGH